jgi:hypothetical protein
MLHLFVVLFTTVFAIEKYSRALEYNAASSGIGRHDTQHNDIQHSDIQSITINKTRHSAK